jgi:plasmid stabilization system protein ParE
LASVIVTPTAQRNLATLIRTHSLPHSTLARFRQSLQPLRDFPLIGARLPRPGPELRFVLGPWRWMVIVYRYYDESAQVRIISIHDARSATSPTSRP